MFIYIYEQKQINLGGPGDPHQDPPPSPPHGGLGEEVPMNTRYTNTSTEENFHISENWKMKDHYRETMQARDAEKRNWRKDMT